MGSLSRRKRLGPFDKLADSNRGRRDKPDEDTKNGNQGDYYDVARIAAGQSQLLLQDNVYNLAYNHG